MNGRYRKAHFHLPKMGLLFACRTLHHRALTGIFTLIFCWVAFPAHEAKAAVAYRASGTFTARTGSISPPYPASMQANDVCLLVVESENQAISLSSAQGFAELPWSPQSAGTSGVNPATRLAVFWKRTVGGDTAPSVADTGDHTTGQIHCFSGVITSGNPWDVGTGGNDGGANDTSGSIPGATTTVDSTLVVLVISTSYNGSSNTQCSNWTNASLTNLTERADNTSTVGFGGGHCMATGDMTTAGTYATTTVTLANTTYKGAISLALKPSAPPVANPTEIHYRWRDDDGPEAGVLNLALICATATCTDVNIDVPLKNHLIALGHTVTTYIDTNHTWTPTNYDVIVISESVLSANTAWLKPYAVPILTVEGQNWDELSMGTSGDSNLGGSLDIDIVNNTHFITSVYPLGTLTINTAGTNTSNDLGYMAGWANGVTDLATYTSNSSWARLLVVDKGGALVTSGTAAERRVFFGARYFGELTSDGIRIFDRALAWVSYLGAGATFLANEDTPVTGYPKLTTIRNRIEIANQGGTTTGAMTYRLEYALSTSGPWTSVPAAATSEDWEMVDSTFITDGQSTQNIIPGLTDVGSPFVSGQLKDTGSTTGAIALGGSQFTELEYSIHATSNATNCQTYYFRVTNAGSTTNFTYTVYPQITLAGSPTCTAPTPVDNLTITANNSQNTITWDNPASNYTQVLVLAKTSDCAFSSDPVGTEPINTTVGTGTVIFNDNPAVDLSSTSVTVGGPTTVSYTAATQRLVHSGLTDGVVYCYKIYMRNGDLIDDDSGAGRPSVTATGTDGVSPSAVWSFNQIASTGATLVQPSVDPGASIYTSYGNGTLVAMDATDGLLSWRVTPASGAIQDQSAVVPMSGSSTCGVAGATTCLFAAAQDGFVYARNVTDGGGTWNYQNGSSDMLQGAPAVQVKAYSNGGFTSTTDLVFAATRDATTMANKVFALNPTVSPPTVVWLYTGGSVNPSLDMITSAPVVDYSNNRLYVTSNSNGGTQRSLWVFNTLNGTLLSTGSTYGGTTLGDIQVPPALSIDGSVVYVGTTAGNIRAYNTSTGALLWSFPAGSAVVSGLWVEFRSGLSGNIFFATANGKIWRIKDNGSSATDLWGAGAPMITAASFPVVIPSSGKVYAAGCSGASCSSGSLAKLYQLAVSTGTKEQCRILGTDVTPGDPAFDTVLEQLIVGATDGKLHAYAAPGGILGGDPSCTP